MPVDTATLVVAAASLIAALGSCIQNAKMRKFTSPCFDMQMGSAKGTPTGSAAADPPSPVGAHRGRAHPLRRSLSMP